MKHGNIKRSSVPSKSTIVIDHCRWWWSLYCSPDPITSVWWQLLSFMPPTVCALCRLNYANQSPEHECSRILPTFPHVLSSCEINPSHMVFMILPWSVNYARKCTRLRIPPSSQATRVVFGDSWWEKSISHGKPYKIYIMTQKKAGARRWTQHSTFFNPVPYIWITTTKIP